MCLDTRFSSAKIYFIQRSICESVRKALFKGHPQPSLLINLLGFARLSTFIFYLFSFPRLVSQARIMPCCKQANVYKDASKTHANQNQVMQLRFASFSISVRNPAFWPEIAIFVETRKSDQYIPIITYRRQWPAMPIPPISASQRNTIARDTAQLRLHHTRSRHTHSQPANDTARQWHRQAGDTLTDPTWYNATQSCSLYTTPHAHGSRPRLWHDTHRASIGAGRARA